MQATTRVPSGRPEVQVGAYLHPASDLTADTIDTGPHEAALLWRAVRRAATTLRSVPADAPPPTELVEGHHAQALHTLCAAWRAAFEGRADARPPCVPERGLLDRLRAAFLREVGSMQVQPAGALVIRMLSALETVRERIDRDEVHRFREKLAGPSAMDLVVEVSHDMRSPLSAILLLTDSLRNANPGTLSPIAQRQVSLLYSAAFGLHAMANDVIELARGGERLFDPDPISFSLGEIMHGASDIVRPMAEEKQLALQVIGPAVDSRIGHPLALSRVLVNLMTNALKFTREGEVRVSANELSRTVVEFAVEDTGVGIPPEVMRSLFEPFRRLKRGATLEDSFSSAGLGLAICRRLVHGMGSELHVQTELGKGTRFSFELALPATTSEL